MKIPKILIRKTRNSTIRKVLKICSSLQFYFSGNKLIHPANLLLKLVRCLEILKSLELDISHMSQNYSHNNLPLKFPIDSQFFRFKIHFLFLHSSFIYVPFFHLANFCTKDTAMRFPSLNKSRHE